MNTCVSDKMLFTGASGFVGRNIIPVLSERYKITTLGTSESNDIRVDISDMDIVSEEKYDVVVHAAGLAHKNKIEEQKYYDINYQGTLNLCRMLENNPPRSFIFISTVAVYGKEEGESITEEYALEGDTPYAKSKIMAEDFLKEWCEEKNVILTILRPSLIAGPNPPGNLGAMIKGIGNNRYFSIAGGKAKKSVLMVRDIANIIPLVENKGGVYNICDDQNPAFRQLENVILNQLGKSTLINIPYALARCMAMVGDLMGKHAPVNSKKLKKIIKPLTFSNEKAKKELGWKPLDVLENFKIK